MNINRQILETPYYTYYVIQNGDTLYKIGKEYNLNPKLIAELNGLKYDEYIYPNQTIILPKKGVQYYITKKDDTLKSVAETFKVKESDLANQNQTIYLLDGQMIFYKEE